MDGKRDSALLGAVLAMLPSGTKKAAKEQEDASEAESSPGAPGTQPTQDVAISGLPQSTPPGSGSYYYRPPPPLSSSFFQPPPQPVVVPSIVLPSRPSLVVVNAEGCAAAPRGAPGVALNGSPFLSPVLIPQSPAGVAPPTAAQYQEGNVPASGRPSALTTVTPTSFVVQSKRKKRMGCSELELPQPTFEAGIGIFKDLFQNGMQAVSRVDFARAMQASKDKASAAAGAAGQCVGRIVDDAGRLCNPVGQVVDDMGSSLLPVQRPPTGSEYSALLPALPERAAPSPQLQPHRQPHLSETCQSQVHAQLPPQMQPQLQQEMVQQQKQAPSYLQQRPKSSSSAQMPQETIPQAQAQALPGDWRWNPQQTEQPFSVQAGTVMGPPGAATMASSKQGTDQTPKEFLENIDASFAGATDTMRSVLTSQAGAGISSESERLRTELREKLARQGAQLRQSVGQLRGGVGENARYKSQTPHGLPLPPSNQNGGGASLANNVVWQSLEGLVDTFEDVFGSLDGEVSVSRPSKALGNDVLFELFDSLDKDGDGLVSRTDFQDAAKVLRDVSPRRPLLPIKNVRFVADAADREPYSARTASPNGSLDYSMSPIAESMISTRTLPPEWARRAKSEKDQRDIDRLHWLRARDMVESTNSKVTDLIRLMKSVITDVLDERLLEGRQQEIDRTHMEERLARENALVRSSIDQLRSEFRALLQVRARYALPQETLPGSGRPSKEVLDWVATRRGRQDSKVYWEDILPAPSVPRPEIPDWHLRELHMPELGIPRLPDLEGVQFPEMPSLDLSLPELPGVSELLADVPEMPRWYVPDTTNLWEGLQDMFKLDDLWSVELNDTSPGARGHMQASRESGHRTPVAAASIGSPTIGFAAAQAAGETSIVEGLGGSNDARLIQPPTQPSVRVV